MLDHTRMDGDGGAAGGSCQALLCPGVGSPSVKEFKGKLDKGPMRRPPTLAMVGGRCFLHPQGGVVELFSSEVYSFVLEELGCGRLSDSARWRRLEGAETTLAAARRGGNHPGSWRRRP